MQHGDSCCTTRMNNNKFKCTPTNIGLIAFMSQVSHMKKIMISISDLNAEHANSVENIFLSFYLTLASYNELE